MTGFGGYSGPYVDCRRLGSGWGFGGLGQFRGPRPQNPSALSYVVFPSGSKDSYIKAVGPKDHTI